MCAYSIAFGVLLWELFTHGSMPYPGVRNSEMRDLLSEGYRIESPEDCPPRMHDLMIHCWEEESENRPTFHEILVTLNSSSIPNISEGK